jgi:hypothetical protein
MNLSTIQAGIACGHGTPPPMWKQADALMPADFDKEFIFVPGGSPLDFWHSHIGFTNFDKHVQYLPVDVALIGGHDFRMDVLKRF